jgi:hypothetical protein
MNIRILSIYECIAILVFSFGCTPDEVKTNAPSTVTHIAPSLTASPLKTSTPTEAPTPLPPTLTPFPILPAEEAKEKLLEILQNNGGCQLPCFLGHTPGITTKEQMDQFFNQFADSTGSSIEVTHSQGPDRRAVLFYFPQSNLNFNAGISARANKESRETGILGMGTFLTGQTEYPWSYSYYDTLKYYMLSNILRTFGKPPQVLVWAVGDDPDRPDVTLWPFYITVIYPDQGIYLKYEMERHRNGNIYFGCPFKSYVNVAVWDPEDDKLLEQVISIMNNSGDLRPYRPLEDATSMSIDDFIETFSNPNNTSCLETPIEIWP